MLARRRAENRRLRDVVAVAEMHVIVGQRFRVVYGQLGDAASERSAQRRGDFLQHRRIVIDPEAEDEMNRSAVRESADPIRGRAVADVADLLRGRSIRCTELKTRIERRKLLRRKAQRGEPRRGEGDVHEALRLLRPARGGGDARQSGGAVDEAGNERAGLRRVGDAENEVPRHVDAIPAKDRPLNVGVVDRCAGHDQDSLDLWWPP